MSGHEVDNLPPPTAEVKNLWKCVFICTYVFLASTEMTSPSSGDGIERMIMMIEMVKILAVLTGTDYKQNRL